MIKISSFQKQLLQYSLLLKKVNVHARGKDVHDLRSLSRRLRAEIWVLENTSKVKVPKVINTGLRRLTQELGVSRQYHVLYKDALLYKLPTKDIKTKRDNSKNDLQNILQTKWLSELSRCLQKLQDQLLKKEVEPDPQKTKNLLKSQAVKLKSSQPLETALEWHELRKGLRKLQYRMEVIALHSEPLKDLQRSLGKAHDLHVLSEYFPKEVRIQKDEGLALKRARKIYQAKIQSALRSLGIP
jgi:CHAD domain-containing protein